METRRAHLLIESYESILAYVDDKMILFREYNICE